MATRQDQIPPDGQNPNPESGITSEVVNPPNPDLSPTTPTEPVQPDGSATTGPSAAPSFRHPRLAGKTPEEIERLVTILENTNKEQGRLLTQQQTAAPKQSEPAPVQTPEPTDAEYWAKPVDVLKSLIRRSVEPLQQEIRSATNRIEAPNHRAQFASKPHFSYLEPAVDLYLTKQGVDPALATADQISTAYYMCLGYAQDNGLLETAAPSQRTAPVVENQPTPTPQTPPMSIPQHRPSSAPLPAPSNQAKPVRQLTENERRLAREMKMTEAQYIEWQDLPEEEVTSATIGREQK